MNPKDPKVVSLFKAPTSTEARLEELLEKVRNDPERHRHLLVVTLNQEATVWDWALAGGPNLIKLFGVLELVKSALVNLAESMATPKH